MLEGCPCLPFGPAAQSAAERSFLGGSGGGGGGAAGTSAASAQTLQTPGAAPASPSSTVDEIRRDLEREIAQSLSASAARIARAEESIAALTGEVDHLKEKQEEQGWINEEAIRCRARDELDTKTFVQTSLAASEDRVASQLTASLSREIELAVASAVERKVAESMAALESDLKRKHHESLRNIEAKASRELLTLAAKVNALETAYRADLAAQMDALKSLLQ
jgi:hypothetical protein